MARPGITYYDVANVALTIKGQGKNVTVENIRAMLGTGSISTINNHLRKWKALQTHTETSSKDNLPIELVSMLKGLWERVTIHSVEQFIPIEEKLKQDINQLTQALEKYKNNNRRWQKLYYRWQQEKAKFANEKNNLIQTIYLLQQEHTSLKIKQDHMRQQLADVTQLLQEAHHKIKQLTQDKWQLLQEKSELTGQLKQINLLEQI